MKKSIIALLFCCSLNSVFAQLKDGFFFNSKPISPEVISGLFFNSDSDINLCKFNYTLAVTKDTPKKIFSRTYEDWYQCVWTDTLSLPGFKFTTDFAYYVVGRVNGNNYVIVSTMNTGGSQTDCNILVIKYSECTLRLTGVIREVIPGSYPVQVKNNKIIYNGNKEYIVGN